METLSCELYGIEPDVDEELYAIRAERDGMERLRDERHLPVARRDDRVRLRRRLHGEAVSHHLGGKDVVRHLRDVDDAPGDGRRELEFPFPKAKHSHFLLMQTGRAAARPQ